ncbi:DHA2 family efflux MFS transporter permease subunit [Hoeflea poritis]|uniref:DHA2 family efflux MFS transporter permease subunit n=1 Tax=Hoeflea poritis TaxID=2993659 RepID=A0ABT4VU84_9HYPH|nr:DHA2 family efflux MFS transporter permease subunit [Hoeflea poritis]MDA4848270.1 DHA2 family efflux MFS transporter permease subunit [Hoeflea poritis]
MLIVNENNRKWWLLTAMSGGLGLVLFDETVVGVALPVIRSELGMSEIASHWVVNAYLLVFAGLVAIGGRMGDLFSLKPLFLAGTALFGLSSVAAGFAPNTETLIIARGIQGIGAAIVFPLSLSIITLIFPPEQRGLALGLNGTIGTVFLALGPFVGGLFADFLSWRWIFWINPFLTAAMIFIVVRAWGDVEERKDERPLDIPGVVLLCAGLGLVVFALMQAPDFGWSNPVTIIPLAVGIVASALFVVHELRNRAPLIDLELFASSTFAASNAIIFLAQFMKVCTFVFGALYFQAKLGMSPFVAGLAILPLVVLQPFLAAPTGMIVDRYGTRLPSVIGVAIALVSVLWFTLAIPGQLYWSILPAFLLWSVAMPFLFIGPQKAVMGSVRPENRGQAGGIVMTGQMLGGTIGMAVASAIFSTTQNYQAIFRAVTALTLVTLVYVWLALGADEAGSGIEARPE